MLTLSRDNIRQALKAITDKSAELIPQKPKELGRMDKFRAIFKPSIIAQRKKQDAVYRAYQRLIKDDLESMQANAPTFEGENASLLANVESAGDADPEKEKEAQVLTDLLALIHITSDDNTKELNQLVSRLLNRQIKANVTVYQNKRQTIETLKRATERKIAISAVDEVDEISKNIAIDLINKLPKIDTLLEEVSSSLDVENLKIKRNWGHLSRWLGLGAKNTIRRAKLANLKEKLERYHTFTTADYDLGSYPDSKKITQHIRLLLEISQLACELGSLAPQVQCDNSIINELLNFPSEQQLQNEIASLKRSYDTQRDITSLRKEKIELEQKIAHANKLIKLAQGPDQAILQQQISSQRRVKEDYERKIDVIIRRTMDNDPTMMKSFEAVISSQVGINSSRSTTPTNSSNSSCRSSMDSEAVSDDEVKVSLTAEVAQLKQQLESLMRKGEYTQGMKLEALSAQLDTLNTEVNRLIQKYEVTKQKAQPYLKKESSGSNTSNFASDSNEVTSSSDEESVDVDGILREKAAKEKEIAEKQSLSPAKKLVSWLSRSSSPKPKPGAAPNNSSTKYRQLSSSCGQ